MGVGVNLQAANDNRNDERSFFQELTEICKQHGFVAVVPDSKGLLKALFDTADIKLITKVLRTIDDPVRFNGSRIYWDYFNARSLLSYASWDIFTAHCMSRYAQEHATSPSVLPLIERTGLSHGVLSEERTNALLEEYLACERISYEPMEYSDYFMFNPWIFGDCKKEFNQFAVYRASSDRIKALIKEVLDEMQPMLEADMGHGFSVIGVKPFELCPLHTSIGPHMWHKDSHPAGCKKLMIYLSETSAESGTTEYEQYDGITYTVGGRGGQWVLFSNSRVKHRGIPPESKNRPIIEVTFMPALITDTTIVDNGINSGYPWFPMPDDDVVTGYFSAQETVMRMLQRSMQLALENGNTGNVSDGIDNMIKRY